MTDLIHPDVPYPETDEDDPRLGTLLGRGVDDPLEARAVIVGFPTDEGVRRNGGRPGAAGGPAAIRRALYRMTPDARRHDAFVRLVERTVDLGDLALGGDRAGDLATSQERLGEAIAPFLRAGVIPIILGGGHETAFGHFQGYVFAGHAVSILNWDAHPDVRPVEGGRTPGRPSGRRCCTSPGRAPATPSPACSRTPRPGRTSTSSKSAGGGSSGARRARSSAWTSSTTPRTDR